MERKTGFEPAAFSLARRCSTTELLPLKNCRPTVSDYALCTRLVQTVKATAVQKVTPTS